MKLKLVMDENREDINPGEPCSFDVVRYGKNVCPSNKTDDTVPNDEDSRDPETHNMRSDSTIELAECVS